MTRIRIVVADDHPIVRSGIVALLGRADDLEVVAEVADGAAAVAAAEEHRPDLVLMDLRMPVLGGAEATARIVQRVPGVRVLVLTTYETDDDILGAIEAGAGGYLLKAAPEQEILAGIRSVVAGQTVLAPTIAATLVGRMQGGTPTRPQLSARELEVLALVAAGNSNRAIAAALFISESTVKTHLLHVFEKLEVADRTRAVTRAQELRLL
ncbi:response regulator transcription factor [Plantibacter sp. VKM Ac-2885]|jgi:DNA-binding NarL/FixJ family response regulator|uniref:response regulator n=1 Tax=unclassified Plantibacter TaxID=2624265 RepID=UPI00178774BD|nr:MULTISPECIES: response regulator transcription factor [unclassified Plantibacter]MBD8517416.1 response regulator transcription factor [Plantibacter sp. CFBP 8804]MBF4511183.1 response regulator transcription factor [Plantibacter sp. VKM Ac-2885]